MAKSITYRFISKLGINLSSGEYESITFIGAIRRGLSGYWKTMLLKYCMYSILFSPLNYRLIRPYLWKKMGCKVGKKVFIGYGVWFDFNYAHLIEIGDNVHIYWPGFLVSCVFITLILFTGIMYFRKTEKTFADII